MDAAALKIRFPELRSASNETLQACIDEAANEISAEELGAAFDGALANLAAHKLAVTPFGRNARMLNDKGESTYLVEYKRIISDNVTSISVTGGLVPVPPPWPYQ